MKVNFKFNKLEKPKEYAKALAWIPCCAALLEFIHWAANGNSFNWYSLAKFSLLLVPYLALILVEKYLARKRLKAISAKGAKISVNCDREMTHSQIKDMLKAIQPD